MHALFADVHGAIEGKIDNCRYQPTENKSSLSCRLNPAHPGSQKITPVEEECRNQQLDLGS